MVRRIACVWGFVGSVAIFGCGGNATSDPETSQPEPAAASDSQENPTPVSKVEDPTADVSSPMQQPISIPSISLSGSPKPQQAKTSNPATKKSTPADENRRLLLEVMKPVQIMLGSWKGTTQKQIGDFKALDEPAWVWDFKTNRDQPAMVMTSA